MKKAILGLAATVLLLLPVSVAGAEQPVKAPAVQENSKQENTMPVPISVEQKNIDGVEYLIKVYELTS